MSADLRSRAIKRIRRDVGSAVLILAVESDKHHRLALALASVAGPKLHKLWCSPTTARIVVDTFTTLDDASEALRNP